MSTPDENDGIGSTPSPIPGNDAPEGDDGH